MNELQTVTEQRDAALSKLAAGEESLARLCVALGIGVATDISSIAERVRMAYADRDTANAQVAELSRHLGEATGALETADREIAAAKNEVLGLRAQLDAERVAGASRISAVDKPLVTE